MSAKENKDYIGYEYKEVTVPLEGSSMYLDCYENFGWTADRGGITVDRNPRFATIRLKRDRKIINKMELTRLQRHFEACVNEIRVLEKQKTASATVWSLAVGLVGTAFMAGATFAAVHEPPMVGLCALMAVPGFMGWILPYFIYHRHVGKTTQRVQPLIEAKHEEIYEICERGHSLL